ncbi:hypothetical protein ABZY30_35195 [Streptomyces massasporeus]|uniref:hypothetical protein n=1 Tax=Streptomyces massasporeus TaxID=67324 RepID=UPI0033BC9C25
MSLPTEALARILQAARNELGQLTEPPRASVPVAQDDWEQSLWDAGLCEEEWLLGGPMDALATAVSEGNAKEIKKRALYLVHDVKSREENLWYLAVLKSGLSQEVLHLRECLHNFAIQVLDDAACGFPDGLRHVDELQAKLDSITSATPSLPSETCVQIFGVARDEICDQRGIFLPSRLLANYRGRIGVLYRRLSSVLSELAKKPLEVESAVDLAWAYTQSGRPLLVLRSAFFASRIVRSGFSADPIFAEPIRRLRARTDRSAANHQGIVQAQQNLRNASTAQQRAFCMLDIYRRVVEGQLRPCAWTVLELRGRSGRLPEIASLRDQLVADGHPVLQDAAQAILPAVRNGAAHEDFEWDEDRELIYVGEDTTAVEDLADGIERAYAFMVGFDCALMALRAEMPELARFLDESDPPQGVRALRERNALNAFGSSGLSVHDWCYERGRLEVVLDRWGMDAFYPGLQAVMWTSRFLENLKEVAVSIRGSESVPVVVSRPALDAMFPVWDEARTLFPVLPAFVFMPAEYSVRVAGGHHHEVAFGVVLRMAIRNTLVMCSSFEESGKSDVLVRRLELVLVAIRQTNALRGDDQCVRANDVESLICRLTEQAAKPKRERVPSVARYLLQKLANVHDRLPAVSPIPGISVDSGK